MFMNASTFLLVPQEIFGNIQYMEEHWEKAALKWNVVTMPHCLQRDSSSCGVYIMKVVN